MALVEGRPIGQTLAAAALTISTFSALAVLGGSKPSEHAESTAECKRHLNLISDAVQYYRLSRGDWPTQLSDLADGFISSEVLICPECERRGLYRIRDLGLRNTGSGESLTVYKWELNTLERTDGDSNKTFRELKFRQRESPVGDGVPIVRCDQHDVDGHPAHLNLTFAGDVFVSGASWEEAFRDLLPTPYLLSEGLIFADVRSIPDRVSPRPLGATVRQLDLKSVATALPQDPWQDGRSRDTFQGLLRARTANGLFHSRGIPFDVRALVQLDGRQRQGAEIGRDELYYQIEPRSLKVRISGHKLHVLGGVVFPAPNGAEIGGLGIKFASGRTQTLPWLYGRDLRDGWHDLQDGAEREKLVWTGELSAYLPKSIPKRPGALKVYQLTFNLAEAEIAEIQFYSSASDPDPAKQYPSGPFLLAMTLE